MSVLPAGSVHFVCIDPGNYFSEKSRARKAIFLTLSKIMKNLYIGTSGWNYKHWSEGVFYPSHISKSHWLEYYASVFNTVELNVTFYRLVPKNNFQDWAKRTPANFRFVVKGSRFITHIKKLKDSRQPFELFMENASGLGEKFAAVLWQLPPVFKKNLERLEEFLCLLKATGIRQVFEFRNSTWFSDDVYKLLESHNACLCIAHSGKFPCVREITTDFLYLRFHGGRSIYSCDYSEAELKEWARFAAKSECKDVFGFFNNDACGYATKNALRFRELLEIRN